MSILIYGKVLFINGQIASSITGGAKVIDKSEFLGSTGTFDIKNGVVTIEFGPEIEERAQKLGPFWLYLMAKDLMASFLFSEELKTNKCLLFFPEYFEIGGKKQAFDWQLPNPNIQIEEVKRIDFINVLLKNPQLREAMNDFHTGLFDITRSPAHFYRVVDTISQVVIGKQGKLEKPEWEKFTQVIGLSDNEAEELDALRQKAILYRHGTYDEKGIEDYNRYFQITKIVILKAYNYLLRQH